MCIQTLLANKRGTDQPLTKQVQNIDEDYGQYGVQQITAIYQNSQRAQADNGCYFVVLDINDKPVKFEWHLK